MTTGAVRRSLERAGAHSEGSALLGRPVDSFFSFPFSVFLVGALRFFPRFFFSLVFVSLSTHRFFLVTEIRLPR